MIVDLHLHTFHSDGTASPEEVLREAAAAGAELVSLCDHNTTAAYAELAGKELPLRVLTGVEIDSTWQGRNLHILAYGFCMEDALLQQMLRKNKQMLEQVSTDLIALMEKDHAEISMADYEAFEREPRHGGWKGIDYLASFGFDGEYPSCMRYYKEYPVVFPTYPSPEEICRAVHAAGGKAVLAHPWCRLPQEREAFLAALSALKQAGIDGVEVFYPDHTPEVRKLLMEFCRENDLFMTAGSDSHGEFAKTVDGITYQIGLERYELEEADVKRLSSCRKL